jgi:origin recognition complex subunit 1
MHHMRDRLQVMDIMRDMRRRSTVGELPRFQFVEINGLRLPTPKHAYTALYEVS